MELPVINHPDYVAKLNDDNKFPIKKFGELAKYLIDSNIVKKNFMFLKMLYRNIKKFTFYRIY